MLTKLHINASCLEDERIDGVVRAPAGRLRSLAIQKINNSLVVALTNGRNFVALRMLIAYLDPSEQNFQTTKRHLKCFTCFGGERHS